MVSTREPPNNILWFPVAGCPITCEQAGWICEHPTQNHFQLQNQLLTPQPSKIIGKTMARTASLDGAAPHYSHPNHTRV